MKPWTRAIRSLVILPPEEGSKKRVNNFRLCKEVAREGLNQSPYIGVKWAKDDSQVRALLDSGADWSCIDVSTLNPEEREALDRLRQQDEELLVKISQLWERYGEI